MADARRTEEHVRTDPREAHDGSECEVKAIPRTMSRSVDAVRSVVMVSKITMERRRVRSGEMARTEI